MRWDGKGCWHCPHLWMVDFIEYLRRISTSGRSGVRSEEEIVRYRR